MQRLTKKILIVALVFFVLGTIFTLNRKNSGKNFDYRKEQEKISEIMEKKGAKEAYAYFKKVVQNSDSNLGHELAHFVGIEIYEKEGIEGVYLCDSTLNWGCYHGFFGVALPKEGEKVIIKAQEVCKEKGKTPSEFGGCVHGIGHGVLSLYGYQVSDLVKALKLCDILEPDTAKGCYNGSFMEFNIRSMLPGQNIRPLNQEKPYEPCNLLEAKYQSACYFEQPAWWVIVTNADFSKIGSYCERLKGENLTACFKGIGRAVPGAVKYNPDKVGDACLKMSTSLGKESCLKEAIYILESDGGLFAPQLCEILDSQGSQRCKIEVGERRCLNLGICQ